MARGALAGHRCGGRECSCSISRAELTGGAAMADLQTVIGLLYRADWTRLSLSAGVRSERDGDLALRRLRAMRPSGFRPGPAMRLRRRPRWRPADHGGRA